MNLDKYEDLVELAEKSGHGQDRKIKQAIFQAVLVENENYMQALQAKLRALAEDCPNPFPKNYNSDFEGEMEIGDTSWGSRVRLQPTKWTPANMWGSTRTGKSSFTCLLANEIRAHTEAALLFYDPKRSLRSLTKDHENVYAVRLDKFPFNPFSVAGALTKRWMQDFADIIAQTGDLLTGSRSHILYVLSSLKEKFEDKSRPPTMFDFLKEARDIQKEFPPGSPSHTYGARLINRLEAQIFIFRETFDYEYGFTVEEFLDPNINLILEADGLDPIHSKTVFLEILFSIYYHQLSEGNRGEGIDIFIFIDEAEEILGHDSPKSRVTGVPIINRLWERGTELKMGLISAVHHTRVNSTVRENAKSRFCFNLSSSQDISKVAKDYGLEEEQEEAIEELEAGEAVAKVKGQLDTPFKLNVDYFPLRPVSDEQIKEDNKELWQKVKDQIKPIENKPQAKKKKEESTQEEVEIDKTSHVLLENIAKFPFLSVTDRRNKLGWGSNKITKVSTELRNIGYLRKKKLRTKGRGRARVIYELTTKSMEYLKSKNVKPKQSEGRGGVIHLYWVTKIKEFLKEKNYDVRKEVKLENVIVDLLAIDEKGTRLAVEVEVTSADHSVSKLPDLLKRADKLVVVFDKKALMKKFKEKLQDLDLDRDLVEIRKAQDMDL